jgi:phage shock protein E
MANSKSQTLLIVALLAVLLGGLAALLTKDQPVPLETGIPTHAVWIDVRSAEEYAQGHLEQAPRISHDQIETGVAELGLAKNAPIYLYCAVGGRAGKAKRRLEAQGYTNVTNVGGLEDAQRLVAAEQP